MAALSGVLAVVAVGVDRELPPEWGPSVPWLTRLSAEGARAVLSTIAGSMITVTGVVFSITVVALTLASSQFGPRLLRTFFRDRGSQIALGSFLATFCYSLLVLRAVEAPERVPYLATSGAVVLSIISLFVLIYFVHHAAASIQASSVIEAVAEEARLQTPSLFPESIGAEEREGPSAAELRAIDLLDRAGSRIASEGEGYVQVIDQDPILETARARDLMVRLDARPGGFVTEGGLVARVYPPDEVDESLVRIVRSAILLGGHRTPVQDIRFLTDQLAEMAVRALSPGVCDPNTAVECLHRLGGVLARLADRAMPSGLRYDADGRLRIVADPCEFSSIVASCFDPVRRYGAEDARVVVAMLGAIASGAGPCTDVDRIRVLREHADEMYTAFLSSRSASSKRDCSRVENAYHETSAVFAKADPIESGITPGKPQAGREL